MSFVIVRKPIGTSSIGESVADVFTKDTLTVTCTDESFNATHGPVATYQPDQWLDATVYDQRGNVLYHHTNSSAPRLQKETAQRIKALVNS